MTAAAARRPARGERLREGILYRRVPNTTLQWNYARQRPTKAAFRPDVDEHGNLEPGVSMYLASLTDIETVLVGHGGYAVCAVDIRRMIAASELKREPVVVVFDPVEPQKHPADPAHCFVEGIYGPMMKVLAKNAEISSVERLPADAVAGVPVADDDEDPRE